MSERAGVASWLAPAAGHAAVLAGLLLRLAWSGQVNEKRFAEFAVPLPAYTEAAVVVSGWLTRYGVVAALLPLLLASANAAWLCRLGGLGRRPGWLWTWGLAGALLSLWALVELAFLLPLLRLYESMEPG